MTTLLFVHIGSNYPEYLLKNIERTRGLFKNNKIALVGDKSPNRNWLQENDIYFKKHEVNALFEKEFSFAEFEEQFRSGYWRFTLERLLSIEEYHQDFPDEELIHLESDVIIFPNFPFEIINSMYKVAWMSHSVAADIATMVFSPNWQASKVFSQHLIQEYSSNGGSDMDVLLRLRKKYREYAIFPTMNKKTLDLINSLNNNSFKPENSELQQLPGIFDAAGIGMWVAGFDPRNKFGFTIIHTRELIDGGILFVDPSRMNFHLSHQGNLFVNVNGGNIPIYNLHIHSKDKDLLSIKWEGRLNYLIAQNNSKPKIIRFSPSVLFRLLISNVKNKSFINFVLQVPLIRKTKSRFMKH